MMPSVAVKFWLNVDMSGECWTWKKCRDTRGYGVTTLFGKFERAHRLSKMLDINRSLVRSEFVCHKCDNPPCVRPDHLFVGTCKDNAADAATKGRLRNRFGEKHPHAKLNNGLVMEIVSRIASGQSKRSLARLFGVHERTIRKIGKRMLWRSVTAS